MHDKAMAIGDIYDSLLVSDEMANRAASRWDLPVLEGP